jgi:hypothetical protein
MNDAAQDRTARVAVSARSRADRAILSVVVALAALGVALEIISISVLSFSANAGVFSAWAAVSTVGFAVGLMLIGGAIFGIARRARA